MNRAEELRTLANVQEEIGDYNAALELHRRAFLLQEKAVGKSSPELAPFNYELAMVHGALDHDGEAARLLNWLVTMVPADHPLRDEAKLVLAELKQAQSAA